MDGDVAPVDELVEICARHGALLVLDEAHAVLGPDPDLDGVDALRVGTLSKTLGALGGFVAGPARLADLLVNRARSYIFTTASTPADTAAALAALAVVRSAEGDELVGAPARATSTGSAPGHPSPIVPVVLGDERARSPRPPRCSSRGCSSPRSGRPRSRRARRGCASPLSAAHTDAQVDALAAALAAL